MNGFFLLCFFVFLCCCWLNEGIPKTKRSQSLLRARASRERERDSTARPSQNSLSLERGGEGAERGEKGRPKMGKKDNNEKLVPAVVLSSAAAPSALDERPRQGPEELLAPRRRVGEQVIVLNDGGRDGRGRGGRGGCCGASAEAGRKGGGGPGRNRSGAAVARRRWRVGDDDSSFQLLLLLRPLLRLEDGLGDRRRVLRVRGRGERGLLPLELLLGLGLQRSGGGSGGWEGRQPSTALKER